MTRGLWAIGGLAVLVGCSDAPSAADCERLLDHVVELELAAPGAPKDPGPRQKLVDQVRKDFLSTCAKELRKAQVACALEAKQGAELAACDET
jgi:hypothetical protein